VSIKPIKLFILFGKMPLANVFLDKKNFKRIGGKIQTVYDFAKKTKKDVKKSSGRKLFPPNPSMNISKFKKIMKWRKM